MSGITSEKLSPLFNLLRQGNSISQRETLTPEAQLTLESVNDNLDNLKIFRYDPSKQLYGIVLLTPKVPLGVLWQDMGPLYWVHLAWSDCHKITPRLESILLMAFKVRLQSQKIFNVEPDVIILPLRRAEFTSLSQNDTLFQTLIAAFTGQIDNHLPPDKLLQTLQTLDISPPPHVFPCRQPIPNAPCVFTDANKTTFGLLVKTANKPDFHHIETHSGSVQLGELQSIIATLQKYQDTPLNIFSDSKYSVQAVTSLPFSAFRSMESQIDQALQTLKSLAGSCKKCQASHGGRT